MLLELQTEKKFFSNEGANNMLYWYVEDFLTKVSVLLVFPSCVIYALWTVHSDIDM
jgi:hypothetical protein